MVNAYTDIHKEIIQLSKELIQFETTQERREEILRCHNYVLNYFSNTKGVYIKKYSSKGIPSIVISNTPTKSFDILFNGHLDIVAAKKKDFTPKVKNGKLFGRGTSDMKTSVAAMMVLLKQLIVETPTSLHVGLMIVFDEEVGGTNGTKYLVEKKGYMSDVVIIPDDMGNLDLTTKEKGILGVDVVFNGTTAHSCEPWKGSSATDSMLLFYAELRKMFPLQKKERWVNTCNIGPINANNPRNQLSDKTTMSLDIRFTEKTELPVLIDRIDGMVKKHNGTMNIAYQAPVVYTSKNHPAVKVFKRTAEKIMGHPMKFLGDHGASDARFFVFPNTAIIMCKPISGNMHADNEWVDIASVKTFYEILLKFVTVYKKQHN